MKINHESNGRGDGETGRRGDKETGGERHIRTFRDLRVWQRAIETAMAVFELTKRFPSEERYSLTDQVRRSSRSVAANIAEAWRKRRYPAAFVSKLNDAEGEAAETQTHVEIALCCGYLKEAEAGEIDAACEEVLSMLVKMAHHPEKWSLSPSPRPPVSPSVT